MTVHVEPIVGRYVHLDLPTGPARLYVEEAGTGPIPLLCLHTAGSDSRQYRHLLNDPAVLERFRVVTFDMPSHGRSSVPADWRDREYVLTSADYVGMVLAVADALELDRPVVMGCSIGGRLVLRLAVDHPDRFRALIGLQAGAAVAPYYDREYLHRPDVHGGELCAALMSGLVGPTPRPPTAPRPCGTTRRAAPGCSRATCTSTRTSRSPPRSWPRSTPAAARSTCSAASTTTPACPRTRWPSPVPSPVRRS